MIIDHDITYRKGDTDVEELLGLVRKALAAGASDLFIVAGQPPTYKVEGHLVTVGEERLSPESSYELISCIYRLSGRSRERYEHTGDDDFAMSVPELSRLRVSAYMQRSSCAAVLRLVPFGIPDHEAMNIPEGVMKLATLKHGLGIVSGTAGSGKSTTLACVIDRINHSRSGHVITLEDPIEYLYRNDRCIISQREVHIDTADYITSIRASLRQSPDVILLGEMRDHETISTAMTAMETGHLVLSTLHTTGSASTVDRIIDIFPPNQQQQVRAQLAYLLRMVVSQQLVPTVDGGLLPVFEILIVNTAVSNLIREGKLNQINGVIATSAAEGMVSMDNSIIELYQSGRITRETAIVSALNPDAMARRLG